MTKLLRINAGQYSAKGLKNINQDFYGLHIPKNHALQTKGISVAIADGISSSQVSQEASKAAVKGFLNDYYSTSESWSVKTSGQRVIEAINSWLFAQTSRSQHRFNLDKGYVCTFSAIVFKSSSAHIFHVGDSRIFRLHNDTLEPLTDVHRTVVSSSESYLSRALGMGARVELDYSIVDLELGDTFLLMTDGIYEYLDNKALGQICADFRGDEQGAAEHIVNAALKNGSDDNVTVQVMRVAELPEKSAVEAYRDLNQLPFPPALHARMQFDGYSIVRRLHASARSHVYLAVDNDTNEQVVIKTLSSELRESAEHIEKFLLEEWIARRVNSAHLLKPCEQARERHYFYVATEYIEGQTLAQWMVDNPKPTIAAVREIIEQIAKGLTAMHRLEMLHQDLRPENIMVDSTGTVKIIDFGATRVAGLQETYAPLRENEILGTAQYTAPEYYLGEYGTVLSDQFSLAVIAYHMLSDRLPYGIKVSSANTRSAQRKLKYRSVLHDDLAIPVWVDDTLKKALHPDPLKRYDAISEFVYDLRTPSTGFKNRTRRPLIERNPVAFWQGVSLSLFIIIIFLIKTYIIVH